MQISGPTELSHALQDMHLQNAIGYLTLLEVDLSPICTLKPQVMSALAYRVCCSLQSPIQSPELQIDESSMNWGAVTKLNPIPSESYTFDVISFNNKQGRLRTFFFLEEADCLQVHSMQREPESQDEAKHRTEWIAFQLHLGIPLKPSSLCEAICRFAPYCPPPCPPPSNVPNTSQSGNIISQWLIVVT